MVDRVLALVLILLMAVPAAAFVAIDGDDPTNEAEAHGGAAGADGKAFTISADGGVEATIVRDSWGVPHIYADDAWSLFYANGYAMAQDRLAQMEILRHVGKGELAKLTGPSGLELDLVTRRELYTHEERVEAYDDLSQEWQDAFAAYAAGVNRWIDESRTDPSKLPVEYPALVAVPEPWAVTDTIAIAQYLLDVFGRGSGGHEVSNAKLLTLLQARLGDEPGESAFTDYVWGLRDTHVYTTIKPEDAPAYATPPGATPLADLDDIPPAQAEAVQAALGAAPVDDAHATFAEALKAVGWPMKFGSNAQLIDERYTASGKPILFGGPQMSYFTPMIPYELGLHGAGFEAVGMGVAGAPGVIIGRSADQAWTVTSGASDQVDIVAERLVGDAYHYEVDGEVLEMDCRIETHLVRPGPADMAPKADPDWRPPHPDVVEQEVCRTVHGPVLYRSDDGQYAFASERSYRGDEVRSGTLWLQIGTTTDIDGFQDLFETFRFTFNFNYVNADGDLLYMHVGCQPVRDTRLDPRLPRPGWDSSFDWKPTEDGADCLSGRDLPHVRDPASGWTVNWNNNPARGWASGDAPELWGATHRAEKMIEELLPVLEAGNVTLDDVRAVNERAATREPYADDLHPLVRQAADDLLMAHVVHALDDWAAADFTYADHDDDGFHDHAAFRLYELWRERYQERVLGDELGDHMRTFSWDPPSAGDPHAADHGAHTNKESLVLDTDAGRTVHAWCDDIDTPLVTETCLDQAKAALADAVQDEPDWMKPLPMRKSKFVALGAGPSYEIDISNRPSFQHFYDWGLPESAARSRNVLPPGASGHMNAADFLLLQGHQNGMPGGAVPPHLEDQLQLYIDYGDKPLIFDSDVLAAYTESVTHLE